MPTCTICGNDQFKLGPAGRVAKNGNPQPPRCIRCRSLERHRIIRQIYDALPDSMLLQLSALQFSDDIGAPKERFSTYEVSQYGAENSIDICNIDRPDASYDWIVCNHVIEHVEDEFAAISELLRITAPDGVLQISVPETFEKLETTEYGAPLEEDHFHWRSYGSDFPLRYSEQLREFRGLQAIASDPVTGCWDVIYLFTRSRDRMNQIGQALYDADLVVLRAC